MLKHLRKLQSGLREFTKMRECKIFSDGTSKMEFQSKQGPMVGWSVRKDGGASKATFI